ncbi:hypothetical protein EOD39_7759 [Acipenser ruthenus]|uniref:Uncharacterized protein n=1 Tax=Acipenser ruthenus TaxID=7906 RepID=A0A662YZ40_ACIRT|nr:hypothetical protein EOD39_7759 [Acipenser ruthenus]
MAEKEVWPTMTMQSAVVTSSLRIKTNWFDGRGNCKALQSVFEAFALVNQWSEAEKGGQLISAQSCILTLPTGERTKYITLAAAAEGAMETTGPVDLLFGRLPEAEDDPALVGPDYVHDLQDRL